MQDAAIFPNKQPHEILATPIQYAKGVGPQRAEILAKLGLTTVRDVLFFFPRDYEDLSNIVSIAELEEGQAASVIGTVDEVDMRSTGVGRSILGVLVRQDGQFVRCLWFNQPYMRDRFHVGERVVVAGAPKRNGFRWEMHHPRASPLSPEDGQPKGEILPVYSLTAGITQPQMRRVVNAVVSAYADVVEEVFPDEFLDQHRLWPIRAALPQIHTPADSFSLEQARRRFIYQELLVMQLALAIRRSRLLANRRSSALPVDARIDARIRRLFPFQLTDDQNRAIAEIAQDMGREIPMNRLLQGDVGSGKTVVAEYAMLLAVAHGHQAALMAPTELLARQHVRTLARDLSESRVRIGLLVGSLSPSARQEVLEQIASGTVDLVIGTHALLQETVRFHRLGLAIIDEQHKFGVQQRARLRQAGLDPHYLVMTATPIPRTVSMTQFGDLDTSILRTSPPGRQRVQTYLAEESQRGSWWEFFRKKLLEGRQGYVITPLVDESSTVAAASVEQAYEALANGELEAFRVGLVHGRQSAAEKEAAMQSFARGEIQVLVATSVVEVGIDVPNATVMTIENGERFGLAQLHQLRGRISRGSQPGFLSVFASPGAQDGKKRLEAFCSTTDGFELAELDFQLRGPGDLFSGKQHGFPPLRIADLTRDADLLEEARQDAWQLTQTDPELGNESLRKLRRMVMVRYGEALELGDVG